MRFGLLSALVVLAASLSLSPLRPPAPATRRALAARLPCVADTNLSSYETETDLNYGASTRIRLKGIQMLGVFNFDTARVSGMIVGRARLHLRYAGADRQLRTLGFSTVATPWTEGAGRGERIAGATCFSSPELGKRHWAAPDSDFTDAAFLPGASIVWYSDVRNDNDGWVSAEINPAIVQAMVAGLSHGLAVTDEKGQTMANNDVFSREQTDSAPYLTVECREGNETETRAAQLVQLEALPAPERVTTTRSAVRIRAAMPPGAFGIEAALRIEGETADSPVPKWVLGVPVAPRAEACLDNLPGNAQIAVMARSVSPSGSRGPWTIARVRSPVRRTRPAALTVPTAFARLGPCPPKTLGPLSVTVTRGDVRLDAETGRPERPVPNRLWNGRAIRLDACRGERLALIVGVWGGGSEVSDTVVRCSPASMQSKGVRVAVSRIRTVRSDRLIADLCVPDGLAKGPPAPLPTGLHLVEIDVLPNQPVGVHSFSLGVSAKPYGAVAFPVEIKVLPAAIPARPGFEVSLNTYGSPARASGLDPASEDGLNEELKYHRLAHAHRCTLTPLGYSHSGTVEPGYAPMLEGAGDARRVKSWSEWDRRFHRYITGEAFDGLPRPRQPITHIYLPFHEAWPEDIRRHYSYAPRDLRYPQIIDDHAMLAGPIERLMSAEYADGFRAVVRAFAEHLTAAGKSPTRAHFYLNNKYYYRDPQNGGRGTSWWLLDEPMHRDDWLALAWFGRLLKAELARLYDARPPRSADQGPSGKAAGQERPRIIFRADISRPQWQRDYLDNTIDLMVVNDELFTRPTLMGRLKQRLGVTLWHYGEAPAPSRPLSEFEAWPTRAYLAGADGVVPWQTVGGDANIERAESTALIVPGRRLGVSGPLATLRLKALGRGAQDVELAIAVARRRGWSREQLRLALADLIASGDGEAMRAALRSALTTQPSPASQAAHRSGHADTGRPRPPRPKP